MQSLLAYTVETMASIWEWLAAAIIMVAGMRGWFWWRGKKELGEEGEKASDLSVVRAIAGPGSKELGLMLSDRVKSWRLGNLISISEKFERIFREKGLDSSDLRSLSMSVGLPMLEHASNAEDDDLQDMWANLLVSATSDPDSDEDSRDLYKTWANVLSQMTRRDCQLLGLVVEDGISGMDADGGMQANPLSQEHVQQAADMPRVVVDVHLEKLTSLGLIYRDIQPFLTTGGPTGWQHAYTPTFLGMNLYANCGNSPSWLVGVDSPNDET